MVKLEESRKANVNQAQTRQQKMQAQQMYADIHKLVRPCTHTDKSNCMDEWLAGQWEEAVVAGNIKQIVTLQGKYLEIIDSATNR